MQAPAVGLQNDGTWRRNHRVDLRFCIPNKVMPEKGIHTLEHLFAGTCATTSSGGVYEDYRISRRWAAVPVST